MELRLIIAGLGGQGVVLVTRLLTQTAMVLGHSVMASETHGMSQRGGSVLSHLKIGGTEAPLIQRGTAHVLLALDPDEAVRNLPFLRRGGAAFVNGENDLPPEVVEHLDRLEISASTLPANRMALEIGAVAVANVVMVGFAAAHAAMPLPIDALHNALPAAVPRGLEYNRRALEAGYDAGRALFADGGEQQSATGG